jgi:hypothetical protein
MLSQDAEAPLSTPTIDLSSIQRPDLRDESTTEKEPLEGAISRLLAQHEKEAQKGVEWGPLGHLFENTKRKSPPFEIEEEEEEELPTKEEKKIVERRRLILKLRCYQTAFPQILEPILSPHELEKMKIRELKRLLTDVKFTVACKNTCKLNTWSAEGALAILEGLLNTYTPIRASGLHQLAHDPDFMDIIKEITLDHMDFVYAKPELRALFLILNKLCMTHFTNAQTVASVLQKPITAEIENIDKEFHTLPS